MIQDIEDLVLENEPRKRLPLLFKHSSPYNTPNNSSLTIDKENEAHLWVLNSCTVKTPSEDSLKNFIKKAKSLNILVIVAGCVPQGEPSAKFIYGVSVIGVNQIDRIVEVTEETLKGNTVKLLNNKRNISTHVPLDLPKVRRNPYIEIIAISTGCLNQCTYCKTKHSRGHLGSYPVKDIVNRAKKSFDESVVELWITSEDTGAYGRDIGSSLPQLLWEIISITPNYGMIRVGMTNPPYIKDHMEEMALILRHPRVYSFLHIPVQSGSDSVLNEMNREYNIEDFCSLIDFMRNEVPGVNIATDIICAFPTETDDNFQETFKLVQKYKFHSLFINQFYPRPGTVAASMPLIPGHIVESNKMKLFRQKNEPIGSIYDVLVTELASDRYHYVGHNKYYEQILIKTDSTDLGKWLKVEIIDVSKFYMKGIKIDQNKDIEAMNFQRKIRPIYHWLKSHGFRIGVYLSVALIYYLF
ncbi:hypothetical protein HZS_4462 [Henneguya salminicola]|nr:hypothetical protein HZS_4462 [Henneguya salminicola]